MNDRDTTLRRLDWDSQFFGRSIARIDSVNLTPSLLTSANHWAAQNQIDCFYYLCPAEDTASARTAGEDGFTCVDIRYTLGLKIPASWLNLNVPAIRTAREADIPVLRTIAGQSHTDSRFYADLHFDRQKCSELYQTWIEKSCHGYEDVVWVWEEDHQAVGYVTGKITGGGKGEIGLVAVDPRWQGKGIGKHLVHRTIGWFQENGAQHISVITQGRNIPAQVLYQKSGFISECMQLWYHKWFDRTMN
jgi:dTDP-4-amino-4,6-dideoxy-D-galactose acyltransferase